MSTSTSYGSLANVGPKSGIREATFAHPTVAEPIGTFNLVLLQRINSKLANQVASLWNEYASCIETWNEARIEELDKLISAKNDECRKYDDRLAKAQERSNNAKMDSISADLKVSETYKMIGNIKNVQLRKFPSESERKLKLQAVAGAEQEHVEALDAAKRAESEFSRHAHAIIDIAKTFQLAVNQLEEMQDEYRKLSGGKRHELDQRNPRDIRRMDGLPV